MCAISFLCGNLFCFCHAAYLARVIEAWVKGIEILCIQLFLNGAQGFTETLEMNYFSCSQETDGICYFRNIADYTKDIIISGPCLLFCSKVFEKICDRIAFTLKFTGIKRNTPSCLWPYTNCMVNIIWSKSGIFDFFHSQVAGELVDDRGNHFQVRQFFSSNIIEYSHGSSVWHGKTLGKISHGGADFAIRATRAQ